MDRNFICAVRYRLYRGSLSARRAWIEIELVCAFSDNDMSLSARRAWIEIVLSYTGQFPDLSLSARRAWIEIIDLMRVVSMSNGRSPQGERG